MASVNDRKNEPLGLHVIHHPGDSHAIDIIFVHGLGGTSRLSWSWDRDLANFWPQEWLPLEPELSDARILTFGYNAHFMSQKGDVFNISDFAKDLLLQMKFGSDANVQALDIGKVGLMVDSRTWTLILIFTGADFVCCSLYGRSGCQKGRPLPHMGYRDLLTM